MSTRNFFSHGLPLRLVAYLSMILWAASPFRKFSTRASLIFQACQKAVGGRPCLESPSLPASAGMLFKVMNRSLSLSHLFFIVCVAHFYVFSYFFSFSHRSEIQGHRAHYHSMITHMQASNDDLHQWYSCVTFSHLTLRYEDAARCVTIITPQHREFLNLVLISPSVFFVVHSYRFGGSSGIHRWPTSTPILLYLMHQWTLYVALLFSFSCD